MSAYSFHMDPIRRHYGGNALERAAYQARERLVCFVTGREFDHTGKTDLVQSGMVGTNLSRELFWIKAEMAERRFKAVVARSIKVALPHELDDDENWALLVQMGCHLAESLDTAVDIAYHKGKSAEATANKHGHFLIPSREWDEDRGEFGAKTRILDEPWKGGGEVIKGFREVWEVIINRALPYWAPKVTCESHASRGTGRIPKKHLGRAATEMECRGIATVGSLYNEAVDEYHDAMDAAWEIERELENLGLRVVAVAEALAVPDLPPEPSATLAEMATQAANDGPATPSLDPDWNLAPASLGEDLETALASVSAADPISAPVDSLPPLNTTPSPLSERDAPLSDLMPRPLDDELEMAMTNVANRPAGQTPSFSLQG